ncbi:hypothetical protein SAMN06309945_2408 [Okibacterium fritillariae]|jgi:hypothetical protein|uniref:Uncharacterized protein n=1 Tax=Okibacterium fritillariae TaxID=123320 RepID=A0A1T5KMH9_9MICO|nr:hypothetical protein SAMN06309945_2408 [Okibacterium fritillariae]
MVSGARRRRSHAIPALARHIGGPAQGKPDLTRGNAVGNGLVSGAGPDIPEDEISGEDTTVAGTEFIGDRLLELTLLHVLNAIKHGRQ